MESLSLHRAHLVVMVSHYENGEVYAVVQGGSAKYTEVSQLPKSSTLTMSMFPDGNVKLVWSGSALSEDSSALCVTTTFSPDGRMRTDTV